MSGSAEPYGIEGLPLLEARNKILAALRPTQKTETVALNQALGPFIEYLAEVSAADYAKSLKAWREAGRPDENTSPDDVSMIAHVDQVMKYLQRTWKQRKTKNFILSIFDHLFLFIFLSNTTKMTLLWMSSVLRQKMMHSIFNNSFSAIAPISKCCSMNFPARQWSLLFFKQRQSSKKVTRIVSQ